MDYSTPGVYVREVDSGAKPIASVATSIPGFMGLFEFNAPVDAIAITGTDGQKKITGKVLPALVDNQGKITGDATAAADNIKEAFQLKNSTVKNVSKFLKLHNVSTGGKTGASFKQTSKGIEVTFNKKTVLDTEGLIDSTGQVLTKDANKLDDFLSEITKTFELVASPKSASDVLEAYGYTYDAATESSLQSEYSLPPISITNKKEFQRWLSGFFAQYLYDTQNLEELIGENIEDPDEAVDAIYDSLGKNPRLKEMYAEFMSTPSVFNFVSALDGFFSNGGGKCYVYLMGVSNLDTSLTENQADKLGLYAFDDCEDIAIMAAPGLNPNQQREMLEMCEIRKDRFAILDGPIVSNGDMKIPASAKGYGAIYVPWFKVTRPSWFKGDQDISISGPLRRKLNKSEKNEVFVPPSGHLCGLMARVDTERGVHKAPANELVLGITGLSQNINRLEQAQYNNRGINCIRDFKDRGIRVWGARTLATKSDPSWKYINVRRLFIMVEQSIMLGSQWAVFEPNDQTLWKKIQRDVRSYLMRVWRSGALFGATPEEAFYVKCDTETNPRYLIDAGQVNVQVGICPVKPAEFVVFAIGQWDGGSLIDE